MAGINRTRRTAGGYAPRAKAVAAGRGIGSIMAGT